MIRNNKCCYLENVSLNNEFTTNFYVVRTSYAVEIHHLAVHVFHSHKNSNAFSHYFPDYESLFRSSFAMTDHIMIIYELLQLNSVINVPTLRPEIARPHSAILSHNYKYASTLHLLEISHLDIARQVCTRWVEANQRARLCL